jgi:hypothetical protein
MVNPDTQSSVTDSLVTALPVSIFFLLITLFLFQIKDSVPSFNLVLWIGFPIAALLITSVVNIITQYISCKKVDVGKAILGALPSLGTIFVGLGIASISYCRIPVASVFAPMIIGQAVDITKNKSTTNINSLKNSNSKECCIPKLTLENVESKYPIVSGFAYGFYVLFASLFGMIIGNGFSQIC